MSAAAEDMNNNSENRSYSMNDMGNRNMQDEENRMMSRGSSQGKGNCRALNARLKMVDFALTDTVLYLDAYPDSKKALEYYDRLIGERERLAQNVNNTCGPLTALDNGNSDHWDWTSTPWPWEADAN